MRINDAAMIYARGSASDFDEWKSEYENPGWGAEELTPLMQKVSSYFLLGILVPISAVFSS